MDFDKVPDELKTQVEGIKNSMGVTSSDLKYKWEAWVMNQAAEPELNQASLERFQEHLVAEATRQSKRAKYSTPKTARVLPKRTPASPKSHHKTQPQLSSDIPSPAYDVYSTREDQGTVVKSFGTSQCDANESTVEIAQAPDYRTMYVKIREAAEAIDNHIEVFLQKMQDHYGFVDDDICNPLLTEQQEKWAIGRIVNEGKLNSETIFLQSANRFGAGTQVHVDVEQLKTFSFFPGQLVAFKGNNPTGESFVAKEVFTLPNPVIENKNRNTFLMVAAGPFTTVDDLSFGPLRDLVEEANTANPSALVLVGPFIDPKHPCIISGDVGNAKSLPDIFKQKVTPFLRKLRVPCILVPGMNDEVGGHIPFPQPPLAKNTLAIPNDCKCASNPGYFSVNDTKIAVTSVDTLQDVRRTIFEEPISSLEHVWDLLVDQRSLYPILPPPKGEVKIDIPHMHQLVFEETPQIMIAVSKLGSMIYPAKGVLCLNPGKLAEQTAAGTYAKIWVGEGEGSVVERTKVEIVKI